MMHLAGAAWLCLWWTHWHSLWWQKVIDPSHGVSAAADAGGGVTRWVPSSVLSCSTGVWGRPQCLLVDGCLKGSIGIAILVGAAGGARGGVGRQRQLMSVGGVLTKMVGG